jgi:hypothetical protein
MKEIMLLEQNPLTGDWLCWIPDTAHAYYYSTEQSAKEFCDKVNRGFEAGIITIDNEGHLRVAANTKN